MFSDKSGKIVRENFKDKSIYYNFSMPPEITEGKSEELILRDIRTGESVDAHVQPPSLLHITAHALSELMHVKEYRKNFLHGKKFKNKTPTYIRDSVVTDYLQTYHGDVKSSRFRDKIRPFAFIDCKVVSITSVRIEPEAAEAMFYFISSNEIMQTLQLNANKLQLASFESLSYLLRADTWSNLNTLDLSYNEFGPDPASGAVGLTGIYRKLYLKVNINLFKINRYCLFALAICTSCRLCPSLTTLKLAGCNILSVHAPIIADLMDQSLTLLNLDLSFNLLRGEGAEVIADSIKQNNVLYDYSYLLISSYYSPKARFFHRTHLNLRKNEIGAIGGVSIADAMEFNHTLKVLNLTDNSVGNNVITIISGRIAGGITDVCNAVCMKELEIPLQYAEGRYDRVELKQLMKSREDSSRRRAAKCTIRTSPSQIPGVSAPEITTFPESESEDPGAA
jgi:hypothetical protein